jgi:hypothetical protein
MGYTVLRLATIPFITFVWRVDPLRHSTIYHAAKVRYMCARAISSRIPRRTEERVPPIRELHHGQIIRRLRIYVLRLATNQVHAFQKCLRMKRVIVFKLSDDVLQVRVLRLPDLPQLTRTRLQFNFYDHSKIILSAQGLLIAHIDKNYVLTR